MAALSITVHDRLVFCRRLSLIPTDLPNLVYHKRQLPLVKLLLCQEACLVH